ncbi:MAG: non-canonical purine NTP pyrophosphatase [Hyphomicrobium sp.]
MKELQQGESLVVASHNPGKVWEINQLIAPFGLNAISAGDLGLPEPEETEQTFEGNAKLKAAAAAKASGLPALADDSGLEVQCLGGAPGIFSARWAGPGKDFGVAMKRVAGEITARSSWTGFGSASRGPRANFISVLCLAWPDGETRLFTGQVFGYLVWPARGGNGFGYDPMFIADGETQTFGEMEPKQKYAISHRTRAFAAFKAECLEHIGEGGTAHGGRLPEREAPSASMEALSAAAANLSTKEELFRFISNLSAGAAGSKTAETAALVAFLSAVQGYLKDTDVSDDEPRWRTIAKALLAASVTKV